MSWLAVEKALINSVIDQSLGYPIIQENATKIQIDEAQSSDFHLEVFNLPTDTDPMTKSELDQYNGVFQISINGKLNKGKAPILTLLDTILTEYKTGRVYTNSGCDIEIAIASPEPPRVNGSYYTADLSITWFAYISR